MSEKTTYLIETRNGDYKVTVPSDWKAVFTPVGATKDDFRKGSMALRFYESDKKQRALFSDVMNFRDLSIPVQRKVIKIDGKTITKIDKNDEELIRTKKVEEYWEDE